jgi:threonine aldolase
MISPSDFRSDTVTRPTAAMRRAMAEAEVGDDVFGEDPTVNELQAHAAEILGKPAALFVPSGTMGNQIAIKAHTQPGQEIICDDRSHIVLYEMGMVSQFSGCLVRDVPTTDGVLGWSDVASRMRQATDHFQGTGLVVIENTHNVGGGTPYSLATIEEISDKAHAQSVPVHMDGARLFNAATAMGYQAKDAVASIDSVSVCFSKGLGAPVGSVLAGEAEFIGRARRIRKALGGGMRQAGVIAAAARIALEEGPALLVRSHADAQFLADSIRQMDGVKLAAEVPTNILFFRVTKPGVTAIAVGEGLKQRGILVMASADRIRVVTHRDVNREDCENAVAALRESLATA